MTNNTKHSDLLERLGTLALGSRLKRLSDVLMNDVNKLYKEHHVNFESRWFALLFLLHEQNNITIVNAAHSLGFTHPAVIQLAEQMENKKLIKTLQSKQDARKRIISLTEKGKKIFAEIQPLLDSIQKANEQLLKESDSTFLERLSKIEKQLSNKNIIERVKTIQRENTNGVKIIPYQDKYAKDFKKLNVEWIKKYFKMERQDELLLNLHKDLIIDKGGAIFFAEYENKIIGTIAMIKHGVKTFELAKMGVTEKYRGLKISHHLMDAAINFGKEKKANSIILDTNSKLIPALALYEKYGFKPYKKKEQEVYERSDVHLKLLI